MEDTTYKKALGLKNAISREELKLHRIEKLLKYNKLCCKIEGDLHSNRSLMGDYYSENAEFIKKLLEADKILVTKELERLNKEFKNL